MRRCLRRRTSPPTTPIASARPNRPAAEMAEKLVSKRIPVLISNHDTLIRANGTKPRSIFRLRCGVALAATAAHVKGGRTRLFIAPEPFCPPVNTFQGDADETVFDCPSILSADFARRVKTRRKLSQLAQMSSISTLWITTTFPI